MNELDMDNKRTRWQVELINKTSGKIFNSNFQNHWRDTCGTNFSRLENYGNIVKQRKMIYNNTLCIGQRLDLEGNPTSLAKMCLHNFWSGERYQNHL